MDLYIYRDLAENPVVKNLMAWKEGGDVSGYYAACGGLLVARAGLREFVAALLLESAPPCGIAEARAYFDRDIGEIYQNLFAFDWGAACGRSGLLPLPFFAGDGAADEPDYREALAGLTRADSAASLGDALLGFFGRYSCADEARYAAFKWKGGALAGVSEADDISFDDLAALGYKKDVLIANTAAFAGGSLLYIATVDLLPIIHSRQNTKKTAALVFLIGAIFLTLIKTFE